jgi:dTDP-4-dehydrorhamnose reductase
VTSPYRIVVTGADGQVGWELVRALQPIGEVIVLTRSTLDLTQIDEIEDVLMGCRPNLICNAAAYTAVDRAEADEETARRVNADAVEVIAIAARRLQAAVIHYSTDYVFDGELGRAYREDDAPTPVNIYGRTKLAGEEALAASGIPSLTIRTSWVYSTRGNNFVRTILRLARERESLGIVDDQYGTPTWARWLADATAQVISSERRAAGSEQSGGRQLFEGSGARVLHVTGDGETTWYEFAREILMLDTKREEQRLVELKAIPTAEYLTPARRPRRSTLDSSLVEARYGIRRTHWRDQLKLALGQ